MAAMEWTDKLSFRSCRWIDPRRIRGGLQSLLKRFGANCSTRWTPSSPTPSNTSIRRTAGWKDRFSGCHKAKRSGSGGVGTLQSVERGDDALRPAADPWKPCWFDNHVATMDAALSSHIESSASIPKPARSAIPRWPTAEGWLICPPHRREEPAPAADRRVSRPDPSRDRRGGR